MHKKEPSSENYRQAICNRFKQHADEPDACPQPVPEGEDEFQAQSPENREPSSQHPTPNTESLPSTQSPAPSTKYSGTPMDPNQNPKPITDRQVFEAKKNDTSQLVDVAGCAEVSTTDLLDPPNVAQSSEVRTRNQEERDVMATHHSDEDEIDLLDCFRIIYKYRWMIIGITFTVMSLTVGWCLCQPRMYQASISIVPPIDMLPRQGGLASQLGGAGSSLLQSMLSEGNLSDLYVGILKSRAVCDALVDQFDLMKGEDIPRTRTAARLTLMNNTSIKASKDGIVHIAVKDRDPNRAAALANAYVEELDQQNKRLSGGQATSKRIFLENRLREIKNELSKIDSLQSRDAQIKEMLFEMLAKEYEVAKIEEAKSMPTIQVLDAAIVPELGMARGTVKKGILAGIVAFILVTLVSFAHEYMKGLKILQAETGAQADAVIQDMGYEVTGELADQGKIMAQHRKKIMPEDKLCSQKA